MFKKMSQNGIVTDMKAENFDVKIKNLRKIYNLIFENVELINRSVSYTLLKKCLFSHFY